MAQNMNDYVGDMHLEAVQDSDPRLLPVYGARGRPPSRLAVALSRAAAGDTLLAVFDTATAEKRARMLAYRWAKRHGAAVSIRRAAVAGGIVITIIRAVVAASA